MIFKATLRKRTTGGGLCGCFAMVLLMNATIGGVCFDYCLWSLFGKDIPWYADAVCGLIGGEVALPLAVVMWIVHFFVERPFFV